MPSEDLTRLLIQGLVHNGAPVPESFAPFVDKSKVGSLPLKPRNQPVVGYRSGTMVPRKATRIQGRRVKKGRRARKQVIKPVEDKDTDSESEGVMIGSESEEKSGVTRSEDGTLSSGTLLSSNGSSVGVKCDKNDQS